MMDNWEDWQKNYQFGTLVIWPPDDVRDMVNQQRYIYDPRSANICETHITLTQPLIKPVTDSGQETIQNVASSFEPFNIRYGPLKSF